MNLNQLKYFYTVCVHGSLTEASEVLYISQPSLSSSIRALEEEFGVVLFNRRRKGMELTAEGKMLFEMCKDILSRTEQLENVMKDMGNERNILRIGIPPMIGSLILPDIFSNFCDLYPEIILEITEGGRTELLDMLADNYLDMVFVLQNDPFEEKFTSTKVATLEIVCCVSNDNSISDLTSVTPQDLNKIPLILFENSFYQTEEIKKWFASEKVSPKIIMQTKQLSTMLTMIYHNVAAGFSFRQVADTSSAYTAIPTVPPTYANANLVWKKDAYYFGCMEKFKKYITENNLFETIK